MEAKGNLRPLVAATVILALAAISSPPAWAQGEAATAEALFLEGRRLMKEGQWQVAADKLRASDRIEPSVGARLSLGDCLAELGKTASAWGAYRNAVNLARQRGDSARADIASKRAAAIEPRLTYAVIRVPAPVEGLEVLFDGEVRPRGLWGQRFPVDPGEHTVSARAQGHEGWSQKLEAGDPGAEVAVEVPALEPVETPDEPDPDPDPVPVEPGVDETPVSAWTTGRKAAVGVAAAGLVGVVAGSVFGLSARSKWNDAKENECDDDLACSPAGVALADDARTAGNISTVAFVVGGAALAGAAALWFLTAPEQGPEGSTALAPVVGPDVSGLALTGRF